LVQIRLPGRELEPETEYRRLLDEYYKGGRPKEPFNPPLRNKAGFSDAELDWLEAGG
jgi:uncharacterized ferritin-like protein (DUF455 family)